MAEFNNSNYGNGSSVNSVSTNSIAMFAADSTMLRIAFRNDTMFLTITPRTTDPTTGKQRWPRDLGRTASLRPHQAAALWKAFEKAILPDIEAKVDHMGYAVVPLNRDNSSLCGFSYAGGRVCFSIFNNVSSDRTCGDITTFMFDTTPAINEYNPNTGNYSILEIQSQAYVAVMAIKSFADMCANYAGHGAKSAMSYNYDMLMGYLQSLIIKMGVTPSLFGSYRGMSANNNPMGGYSNDGPSIGTSATGGQAHLMQPPQGGLGTGVTWNSSMNDSASLGHVNQSPAQQVSQLSELIG